MGRPRGGAAQGLRAREGKRPYQIVKRTFGYAKVRYRGIARGASRILTLLASANLLMCARAGRQEEFLGASVAAA